MSYNFNLKSDMYYWNPWHGCHKCSNGCHHCYVFEHDKNIGIITDLVKINKSQFRYPIQKKRKQLYNCEKYELEYKIPSGSIIVTCNTSDFFIREADVWRQEAWEFIHSRQDCLFIITTKRIDRVKQCLPDNWVDGWNNVVINVSIEDENKALERVPILLDLPIKHKGIIIKPMLEQIDIRPYLSSGFIEHVIVGGDSYTGYDGVAKELDLKWVKDIQQQCIEYDVPFNFHNTGTRLKVDDRKIITVMKKTDEYGLAQFYGFNIEEAGGVNWRITAEELELQSLAENAHNIYNKILIENYEL